MSLMYTNLSEKRSNKKGELVGAYTPSIYVALS